MLVKYTINAKCRSFCSVSLKNVCLGVDQTFSPNRKTITDVLFLLDLKRIICLILYVIIYFESNYINWIFVKLQLSSNEFNSHTINKKSLNFNSVLKYHSNRTKNHSQ